MDNSDPTESNLVVTHHHLAVHIVNDLEYLGPGHARSTPVFERINHRLQEIKKNGHQGEVEATMLKMYCRQANLELLLDHNVEIREEIKEALCTLKDIEREDHCGIFTGTDLLAWSSTQFKATSIYIKESPFDCIVHHLNTVYTVPESYWDGKVTRQAQLVGGVAHGRVIYSPKVRQNSVIFHDGGNIHAATIESVINHSHPHPTTRESVTITYIEISILEPIKPEDDLYRDLDCGWLCLQTPTLKKILTIPLTNVISHFTRTDLSFLVKGKRVTHVFPVPKKIRILSADTLHVRLLEEQVEHDFTEAVQLHERVRHLCSEVEIQTHRTQTTNEPRIRMKNELDNVAATIFNYRKHILVLLGCDVADEQCIQAIATNEAKQFWSFVKEVKRRNGTVANTKETHSFLHTVTRPELDGPEDTSSSDLTAILVQQCVGLDEWSEFISLLKDEDLDDNHEETQASSKYSATYAYYGVPSPWLEVKLLCLLQYYPPSGRAKSVMSQDPHSNQRICCFSHCYWCCTDSGCLGLDWGRIDGPSSSEQPNQAIGPNVNRWSNSDGNKVPMPLTSFIAAVHIDDLEALSVTFAKIPPNVIAPPTQELLHVEFKKAFSTPPILTVLFLAGSHQTTSIQLPIVLTKHMDHVKLGQANFFE
ncbi:hypothetical protein F5050DRAFT_1819330 [Lentinula boryana]|uniref:Uncharacterized protein n=1 Tax=Lentinula boryana TaxID=40481 RepID=A0ABQ8QCS9_9AGAR|nr:hypothetical protein F5050DRAFT_1819330 [Lentinula boryana]